MKIERTIHLGKHWGILVIAPHKTGKTVLAATASEYDFDPAKPPPDLMDLDDLLFLDFDGGLKTLSKFNVTAPHIDMFTYSGEQLVNGAAMAKMQKLVEEEVKAGRCKTLVVDTLSEMDRAVVDYCLDQDPTVRGYGPVKRFHIKFGLWLKALPCNVLMLCHSHFQIDVEGKKAKEEKNTTKLRKDAERMPGQADVIPDITGKGAAVYKNCDIQMPFLTRKAGNLESRFLYPHGLPGWESGTRLAGLDMKEPAHIGRLVEKSRKATRKDSKGE